jgi:hypothetical protein
MRRQDTKSNYMTATNNFTEYGKNRAGLIEMYQNLGGEIRKYSNESSLRLEAVPTNTGHPDAQAGE